MVRLLREHPLTTTPPPSNLGPLAEPWAREITRQVQDQATAIERLGGSLSNDGSATNGSLDNIAFQINELEQRQAGVVFADNLTTASFTQPNTVTNIITLQIPRPDRPRVGTLSVQFTAQANSALQTEVYGSFAIDGMIFHRDSRTVPTQNFEPSSWNGLKAITGYTGFSAGPGFGGELVLKLQSEAAFSSGARTVTYTGIQANYQYGQAI